MNQIVAKIIEIRSTDNFSLVSLEAEEIPLKAIVLEQEGAKDYLQVNKEIKVLFKETEVSISTASDLPISLQNCIPGKIVEIKSHELLSRITLDSALGNINALITSDAVRRLNLSVGTEAYAMIKTNELMLSAQ